MTKSTTSIPCTHGRAMCSCVRPILTGEYNPVGSYVTEFDLADGLKEKRVCISFQGVEEAFMCG
ncbi:MAG: hypothetical protein ACLR0U_08655 [Enterocloster clostridioformis]